MGQTLFTVTLNRNAPSSETDNQGIYWTFDLEKAREIAVRAFKARCPNKELEEAFGGYYIRDEGAVQSRSAVVRIVEASMDDEFWLQYIRPIKSGENV